MSSPRGLHTLARLHGVQTAYYDHDGRRVGATADGLMAVLRAMGVPVERAADIPGALGRRRRALWERVVEPVVVAWLPGAGTFELRLPEGLADAAVRVTAALEEGGERSVERPTAGLPVTGREELDGRTFLALEAPLPEVPAGYHELRVDVTPGSSRPRRCRALLVAAPRRSAGWEVLPGAPAWGVFAPLFALWSEAEPDRIPYFGLLDRLADRVAEMGGSVVGTLPLLASFLDRPYEPSPYMPVSKLFWNPLYAADPDAVVGAADGGFGEVMDPRAAMTARRSRLAEAARAFYEAHDDPAGVEGDADPGPGPGPRVPREMAAFVGRNPRARDYARFRALTEALGPWPRWPDRLRARDVRSGDYDADLARYHLYGQWQAERQLAEAEERAAARGVALYLDLPLGVHPEGYDVWRDRRQFALGATVGAPPDPLAPGGQDWGFHPPHPEASRLDGHRYFIGAIRHHLRFARVLRIDHVMQLHRLFWVPGGEAADGVYVRYPHEELFAILSLESHRAGSVIVGEDLGTVPEVVRRSMREHGVPGTYVVQFSLRETADSGALVPGRVPEGALAGIGTHDTPTFAAWWTGRDAQVRAERGLLDPEDAEAQVRGRGELREKLARGLAGEVELEAGGDGSLPAEGPAVQAGLYRFLGRSSAGLVLANMEDLWMETEPQNVPGTPGEENWRRRARRPLDAVAAGEPARLLTALDEARKGTE